MKMDEETKIRNIIFIVIIVICVLALSYGIYFQVFVKNRDVVSTPPPVVTEEIEFDELFDNKFHVQEGRPLPNVSKLDQTKDIVYTNYTLNEVYDGKYDIKASIPMININHEKIINIDKEITSIFYNKLNNILENSKKEDAQNSIYSVSYSAFINENILSLVIKATLKEGNTPQRLIIKGYTYNLSTNEEIALKDMLEIKNIDKTLVETEINKKVQESINYTNNMSSLGYDVYKRDINNTIYKVENVDNYILGPNGSIYIIYAYGNSNYTTESDIVYIK
ncbi:MAG: hypothetical protein HFJ23_08205 [Clostridia bacterium]|nr:hypothetical protein [Clostridia bacterium]